MLDIQQLQESIHKNSIKSIESLQLIKIRITVELKNEMEAHQRRILESDLRRCDAITEQILCLEIMQEFYNAPQMSIFSKG